MPVDTHCPIIVLVMGFALFLAGALGRTEVISLDQNRRTSMVLSVALAVIGLALMIVSRL